MNFSDGVVLIKYDQKLIDQFCTLDPDLKDPYLLIFMHFVASSSLMNKDSPGYHPQALTYHL